MPSDGKFLGDWKEGEKIAQNGRDMTWTDQPGSANGGSCYNCHQISKEELSFGSIGPSLYNYGKLRGVADPSAVGSKSMVDYTWASSEVPRVITPARACRALAMPASSMKPSCVM